MLQVTSLLTDLQLLASSEAEEEHDKAFYTASWKHYSQVKGLLVTDCSVHLPNARGLLEGRCQLQKKIS